MMNDSLELSGSPPLQAAEFHLLGFCGPVPVLTAAVCRLVLAHWEQVGRLACPDWPKDIAIRDLFFRDLVRSVALRTGLDKLLGPDLVLWGASVVMREPGQEHLFHTDIESSDPRGGFVSLWIGLDNTCRESSLQLITQSHLIGKTVQQSVRERGYARGQATPSEMLDWVREQRPDAAFVQPDMGDGDGLIFDGRIWHGSCNASGYRRAALLLQYARSGVEVPIQAFGCVEWPFTYSGRMAPAVAVSNTASSPPHEQEGLRLPNVCTAIGRDEGRSAGEMGWKPYPILHGRTPNVSAIGSHVSVLSPGCSPHPPHRHVEEELLIVLEGEATLIIPTSDADASPRVERLQPGEFVYYPAYQYHTIRNDKDRSLKYQMFRWQGLPRPTEHPLETSIYRTLVALPGEAISETRMSVIFEAPTAYLSRLHAHVTVMPSGAGYHAHEDDHDVAILVFSGRLETCGDTIGPLDSIYHGAGEPHGLRNAGGTAACYLVFEFHA